MGTHPEDRIARCDPAEIRVRPIGPHPLEEGADLHLPAAKVGAQDIQLLRVGELGERDRLMTTPSRSSTWLPARTLRTPWVTRRGAPR